ncbi:F0F1 ATP synthase subunit B [Amycolatopsis sp. cg5]|uniref:F0F1 ATP synthase subunit B n=1 Tax=Amycolatopsis sp. cg5 TaxID=3238802 RepID=UPI003524BEAF
MLNTELVLAAEEKINPIIPHPEEIVIGLIAFLILFFLIKKFVAPRFETLYQERTEKIEGGIAKAEQAQAKAEAALEKYNAQLADARTEAAKIRDDARQEAEVIKAELRAEAQAESERIVAQGHAQLQAQKQQIVAELRAELGRNAVELASRIVGESLEDEVRRRGTVDRFLAELETSAAATGAGK